MKETNSNVLKVVAAMQSDASLFPEVREALQRYSLDIIEAIREDDRERMKRVGTARGSFEGGIDAADLFNVVMIALLGKNPMNGMRLKPCSHLIRNARVKLEEILDLANLGLKAKGVKHEG